MKKRFFNRFISVFATAVCIVMMLGFTSGCSYEQIKVQFTGSQYTGTPYSINSEIEQKELDSVSLTDSHRYDGYVSTIYDTNASEWIVQAGDFEYEKHAAQIYYSEEYFEDGLPLSDDQRNAFMTDYTMYSFDDSGTGVFIVFIPEDAGMGQGSFYIEYTSDYGNTWSVCDSIFHSSFLPENIKVAGNKVYILCSSSTYSESFIMYSDDLCKTFRNVNILSMLPQYKEQLEFLSEYMNMRILSVDETDSALIIGLYNAYEYNYAFDEFILKEDKFFLIIKADSEFRSCNILYSDNTYIRETAYKFEHLYD